MAAPTYVSVVIGADGLPLIAYYDVTAKTLKLARCTNVPCSSATVSTIDATADVGQYSTIATNLAGRFVIAYHDATNKDLKGPTAPTRPARRAPW